jgi:hypothetical protein
LATSSMEIPMWPKPVPNIVRIHSVIAGHLQRHVLRIGLGASAEKHVGILFFRDVTLAQNLQSKKTERFARPLEVARRGTRRAAEHLPLRPTYRRDTRLRCLENALV